MAIFYVDLNAVGNNDGSEGNAFTTIQQALNAAHDNGAETADTIKIASGVYNETLNINSSVSIEGAYADKAPDDPDRLAPHETVIHSSDEVTITLNADNISLKGLTLTNDSGWSVVANDASVTGTVIENNIVQSISAQSDVYDICLYNYPDDIPTDATISHNDVSGGTIGILLYNNAYATADNNNVHDTAVGIQTGNMWRPALLGSNPEIANNTIEASDVGIFHNLQYASATPFSIHDNQVVGAAGAGDDGVGIIVWSLQSGVTVSIEDNDVTGFYEGYELWNDPGADVTIHGGDVSGNGIGIAALDFSSYGDGATSAYTLDGVDLHDNDVDVHISDTTLTVDDSDPDHPTTIATLSTAGTGQFDAGNFAGETPETAGTPGNDVLFAEAGNQLIDGLGGTDYIDMTAAGSAGAIVDLALGAGGIATSGVTGLDLLSHIENATGSAGNDFIAGNDGTNLLDGAGGDDYLQGREGDDTLVGGAGNDTMAGGADNDTYYVNSSTDVVIEACGDGTDTVHSSVSYTLTANVENLVLDASDLQTFDNFGIGAITNGEHGWKAVAENHDEEVVLLTDGNRVFRMSSDPDHPDGAGPYTPGLSVAAGETGTGADGNTQVISFRFKPVVADSDNHYLDNSRMEIDIGNEDGTDRNNFLAIESIKDEGIRVSVSEPRLDGHWSTGAIDDNFAAFTGNRTLESGLDASVWHIIKLVVTYNDGTDNDLIKVYVDDVCVGETTTFENYRDAGAEVNHDANSAANLTNRIVFRAAAKGAHTDGPGQDNQGFYFDDLYSSVGANLSGTGNDRDNQITGNDGDNALDGKGGHDVINGMGGNDTVTLHAGDRDDVDGGSGNDSVNIVDDGCVNYESVYLYNGHILYSSGGYLQSIEHLTLAMGSGSDTLNYGDWGTSSGLSVNLATGTANGFDWISGVENVVGGSGADSLIGDNKDNVLEGRSGNDNIDGGAGSDTAVFDGYFSDYKIQSVGLGFSVTSLTTGDADFIKDIEKLHFTGSGANITIADGGVVSVGPSITSIDTNAVDENAGVAIVGTAHVSDANSVNGDIMTYTLLSSNGGTFSGPFSIDGGGVIRTTGPLNFESQATYDFKVKVTDSTGNSVTQDVTISVKDLNDIAPVITSGSSVTVAESADVGTALLALVATDADNNDLFGVPTFAVTGGTDAAKFSIDDGVLKLAQELDFETKTSYSVEVTASQGITKSAPQTITVSVTDANEGLPDGASIPDTSISIQTGTTKTALGPLTDVTGYTFDVVSMNTLGGHIYNGAAELTTADDLTLAQVNALTYSSGTVGTGSLVLRAHQGNDPDDDSFNVILSVTPATKDSINDGATGKLLDGAAGDDTVKGNAGDDTIFGGAGKDKLYGGAGHDSLTGGADNDQFVFNIKPVAADSDTITDFSRGHDKIVIENKYYSVGSSITSAEVWHNTTGRAHDSNDRFILETDTGKLFYDKDGSGKGAAILIATFDDGAGHHLTNLSSSDFLVI